MDEIVLDKGTFKALAMDTRIDILKSLNERRKTASELSKELNLSVPTVTEHLEKLQDAALVKRQKQGKKWIYYSLTPKGKGILSPKVSSVFVFALSISIVLMLIGSLNLFTLTETPYTIQRTINVPGETVKTYDSSENEVAIAGAPLSNNESNSVTENQQTQTIEEAHLLQSQEISYEFLGVLVIGVVLFASTLIWFRKRTKLK